MNLRIPTFNERFYAHLIVLSLLIVGLIPGQIHEPNRMIASIIGILILIISGINAYKNDHISDRTNKINELIVSFLVIVALAVNVFPINTHNPFSLFKIEFVKSILLISLPFFLFSIKNNVKYLELFVKHIPFLILLTINLFFILFDFKSIDPYDNSRHFYNSLAIYDFFKSNEPFKILKIIFFYDFYQPLTYFVSVIFMIALGKSYTAALLSMPLFWLPLGYYSTFNFINKYFRLSASYSSLASYVIYGSLITVSMTRQFMLDFPCLAMLSVFFYFLAKSEFLKNSRLTFFAGIVFGLGILTKSNFLLLAITSVFYSVIRLIYKIIKGSFNLQKILLNIILFLTGVFLGGGFWYLVNNGHFEYTLDSVTTQAGIDEGDPYPFSFESVITYPRFYIYYYTPLILVILIYGFILLLRFKNGFRFYTFVFVTSLLLAYTIGTITWNKDARTLFPGIIFFLPSFIAIYKLNNRYLRFLLPNTLFLITILTNISISFNDPFRIVGKYIDHPYNSEIYPTLPSSKDDLKSYYVYNQFIKNIKNQNESSFNFDISRKTMFTDIVYNNLLSDLNLPNKLDATGYNVCMWKDYYWPDYYLYLTKVDSNSLYIKKASEQKTIGGDIHILFYEGHIDEYKYRLPNDTSTFVIPLNNKSTKIRFTLRIYHSHPSGQWASFVMRMLGDNTYNGGDIPMNQFSNSKNEYEFIINKK
jgi:hypothetical protein